MKYLGIDFGLRKIGLAISEGDLASPWQIVQVNNCPDALEKISQIIKQENFDKIIVGMPEGKIGKHTKGFVNALQKKGFTVEITSEILSSKKALQTMIEQGIGQKKRHFEDAYSATEILQNYLESL